MNGLWLFISMSGTHKPYPVFGAVADRVQAGGVRAGGNYKL